MFRKSIKHKIVGIAGLIVLVVITSLLSIGQTHAGRPAPGAEVGTGFA
jgi:hypothetical protein